MRDRRALGSGHAIKRLAETRTALSYGAPFLKTLEAFNATYVALNDTRPAPVVRRSRQKDPTSGSKQTLSWLHISDIHLRGGDGAATWLQDQVTQQFLEHVPTLLEHDDLEPDLLFITGDITQTAQPSQYNVATTFWA